MLDILALLVPHVQPVEERLGTLVRADGKFGYATGIERFSRLENSRISDGKDQGDWHRCPAGMQQRRRR